VTLQILIVAAVISLVINMVTEDDKSIAWIEGAAILLAVCVCTLVASINDYQKELQFIQLNQVAEDRNKITVIRDGQEVDI